MTQTNTLAPSRSPRPSGLADVLELILDRGLVIDAYIRVSVVGIELLVVDARIVVASVDTYLRFAEAVNRLDLTQSQPSMTLPDMIEGGAEAAGRRKGEGAVEKGRESLEAAKEKVSGIFGEANSGERSEPGAKRQEPAKESEASHGEAQVAEEQTSESKDTTESDGRDGDREDSPEAGRSPSEDSSNVLSRMRQRGRVFDA